MKAAGNPSSALLEGLDASLDEFLRELYGYCREERSIEERTRTLDYVRTKLAAYTECPSYESKKNIRFRIIIRKALEVIDSEKGIVRMDLEYPERFLVFPEERPPLARWNGKVSELLEYSLAPWYAGKLLKPSGEPMEYADVIKMIENTYGIKVPGAYDRKTDILSRQKPTVFLEKLVAFMKTEAKKIFK